MKVGFSKNLIAIFAKFRENPYLCQEKAKNETF